MIATLILSTLFAAADTVTAAEDVLAQIETWRLIVGGFLPFFLARIVNNQAREAVKFVIAMGASIAASLIVLVPGTDFAALGVEGVALWVLSFVGVVQVVFKAVSLSLRGMTGQSLNEQPVMVPDKGIGAGE